MHIKSITIGDFCTNEIAATIVTSSNNKEALAVKRMSRYSLLDFYLSIKMEDF